MRTGFKNFRRDYPKSSLSAQKPPKKRKAIDIEENSETEIEYQEAVDQMKAESRKENKREKLCYVHGSYIVKKKKVHGLQKSAH